jgi:putative copper resistance protein D
MSAADWPVIAARFALYGDLTLLFGLPLFGLYGLRGEERRDRRLIPFRPLIMALALAGVVLSTIAFIIMTAAMAGTGIFEVEPGTLTMLLSQTAVGTAFEVRTAALILCVLAASGVPRHPVAALGALSIAAGIALATLVWSGHGVATQGAAWAVHVGADILHLLAAGAWVGALFSLLALAARATPGDAAAIRTLHRALRGFAAVGTIIVGLIVGTGLANGLFLVDLAEAPRLVTDPWGQLLLAKIALFGGMLALAATNRFRLAPALDHAMARGEQRTALSMLKRSLTLETTLAIVILALVAWLGTLEPIAAG